MKHDVVIIGAGPNGLITAAYLAKAGLKPLVLERSKRIGGLATTAEIIPGFRCSLVFHSAGPLLPHIAADLQLQRFGMEMISPDARLTALNASGKSVTFSNDVKITAAQIAEVSRTDADSYPEFAKSFARIGKVLAPLLSMTPPSLDNPKPGEVWDLGKVGLAFRGLGKKDAFRLLRWGPMAVADLAAEWFEHDLLRAAVAARGIFGSFAGPWSAGTSTGLLWQAAVDGSPLSPAAFIKGGMGQLSQSLAEAAVSLGATIRTDAEVGRIRVEDNRSTGVVLQQGEEISSDVVVSSANPKTTFLSLVDPLDLDPAFIGKMRNYRTVGTAAKVNLALSALPSFAGVEPADAPKQLSGRIHVGPEIDYLEKAFDAAKYGDFSRQPYLDITIPSLTDETLVPSGGHVMSIHVQFAPFSLKEGDWNSRREELGDAVMNLLAKYSPDIKSLVLGRQVITPLDIQDVYGAEGGHIMHGEQSLDQFFTFRPLIGWAQYRAPISGLYLCGSGTHPGGSITGGSGANASKEIVKDLKRRR